ncbi:small ribosomal subunit protein uS3mA-like [Montipora capricornis]|uniref:small ribosomal subunit protein uS3mA-like n=1 Tax=Montipora foliosa TaxID=591990 RepID=UPI0035F1EE67
MPITGYRNLLKVASYQSLGQVRLRGIEAISKNAACFPAIGVMPFTPGILGVRYAYQPKSKQQKKGNVVPSYRIGVTQSWDSQHTGSLKGSYWASERLLDDIMIRKFVDGVMHGFVQSEVVIKRKANRISLVFLVSKELDIVKFYFLVGFTEKLLTELLGCVVKIEPQSVYS